VPCRAAGQWRCPPEPRHHVISFLVDEDQASGHSPDDPSPGDLWYVMVRRGGLLPEIVMLDSSGIKYHTGVWNGRCFSGVPEMYYPYVLRHVLCLPGDGEPQRGQLQLQHVKAERAVWEPDE